MLPREKHVQVVGTYLLRHAHGEYRRVGITFKRLIMPHERNVRVRARCVRGCLGHSPGTRGFVPPRRMRGLEMLKWSILHIKVTRKGWVGHYIVLRKAATEKPRQREFCLRPGERRPYTCRRHGTGASKPKNPVEKVEQYAEPMTPPTPIVPGEENSEGPPGVAAEHEPITSFDNTNGDRAPYSSGFNYAYQPFTAGSDTVTYLGATVGNPNLPVGSASSDTMTLRLCESASCVGTELASASAPVDNYMLTTADIGDVEVTPGETYYLRWSPPEDAHGASWVTFWHGGLSSVEGSQQMEAVVRGYDQAVGDPSPARRGIVDYAGGRPPPAPYASPFSFALSVLRGRLGHDHDGWPCGRQSEAASWCHEPGKLHCRPALRNAGLRNWDTRDGESRNRQLRDHRSAARRRRGHQGREVLPLLAIATEAGRRELGDVLDRRGPAVEEATRLQAFARGYNRSGVPATAAADEEQAGSGAFRRSRTRTTRRAKGRRSERWRSSKSAASCSIPRSSPSNPTATGTESTPPRGTTGTMPRRTPSGTACRPGKGQKSSTPTSACPTAKPRCQSIKPPGRHPAAL